MTPEDIAARATRYVSTLNRHDTTAGKQRGEHFALVVNPSARGRYDRVVRTTPNGEPAAVHAFIERATGLVFKPQGWSAPAKGARYDLTNEDSYAALLQAVTNPHAFAGGYLYARGR